MVCTFQVLGDPTLTVIANIRQMPLPTNRLRITLTSTCCLKTAYHLQLTLSQLHTVYQFELFLSENTSNDLNKLN